MTREEIIKVIKGANLDTETKDIKNFDEKFEDLCLDELEKFIYSQYSREKQTQDNTNFLYNSFLTDTENLKVDVIKYLKTKQFPENIQDAYLKCLKIAIKSHWVRNCVAECKLALKENRESKYPDFPEF